jgi:hypothetical protein
LQDLTCFPHIFVKEDAESVIGEVLDDRGPSAEAYDAMVWVSNEDIHGTRSKVINHVGVSTNECFL